MQKKIALINDVTGFGRCSIAVMAPIVSAMKIQAVTVPTAILSAHTQFPEYYFDDYTPKMRDYIQTYKDLDLSFDAIATGFLGSMEQVEIVIDFVKTFRKPENFVLVDPVMGDGGKLYRTYTPEMCDKMKELVQYADVLTPNLTELCTLLGREYPSRKVTLEELHDMCREISEKGPNHVIVTGINLNSTQIANYIYNAATQDENGAVSSENFQMVMVDRIGGDRSGTGDVISSVIAGMLVNGYSVYEAVKKAADFVSKCIRRCEQENIPNHYGLCFENFMSELVNI